MVAEDPIELSLDGDHISDGRPFVFLQMIEDEWPYRDDRSLSDEYRMRKPACALDFTPASVRIRIHNVGKTASDLVVLDYRIILCSAAVHGPHDGFLTEHAGEIMPLPTDLFLTAELVPPGGSIIVPLQWDAPPWLENIYLRARVSTLWEESIPPADWDPIVDPRVTEAYLKIN